MKKILFSVYLFLFLKPIFLLGSCAPQPPLELHARVEKCTALKGKDIVQNSMKTSYLSESGKNALIQDYTGALIETLNAAHSKEVYFISQPYGFKCKKILGKTLTAQVRHSCCDGDPEVPCLLREKKVRGYIKEFQAAP